MPRVLHARRYLQRPSRANGREDVRGIYGLDKRNLDGATGRHYEVKSFTTDIRRSDVAAYGVFHGTIQAKVARFRQLGAE